MTQNKPIPTNISELAIEMREGFDRIDTKIDDSIHELARVVASGFKEVDVRFTEVHGRIDQLEDNLENRIDTLEKVIVKDHGTRLRRVERKLQLV